MLGSGLTRRYLLYAICEIALVVIGILIALQIDHWNEEIQSSSIEQELLRGIQEEILVNKSQMEVVIGHHEHSYGCNKQLLEYYHQQDYAEHSETIDSLANCLISYWTFGPRLGFIKSLISSGSLRHIKNDRLLTLLSQFEDQVADANEAQNWIIDNWQNSLGPIVKSYIPTTTRQGIVNSEYRSTLPLSAFDADYGGFFQDRLGESLIAQISGWQANAVEEEKEVLATIDEILTILKTSIEPQ